MSSFTFSPSPTPTFLRSINPKLSTSSRPCLKPPRSSFSDPFVLEIAEKLEDSLSPLPLLNPLRLSSSQSLLSKPWPTPKQEAFRFTDVSLLKKSQISPVHPPNPSPEVNSLLSSSALLLTVVNGHVIPSLSRLPSSLPSSVFIGSIHDLPPNPKLTSLLSDSRFADGDLFFDLNGVGAADVAVVYVPEGVSLGDEPVHLRFCYEDGSEVGEGRLPVSNPRVLVVAEKGAEVAIVEEHVGVNGSEERCYWANAVVEIVVEEGAKVNHTYLQRQSVNAAHIKWTFTRQVF